MGVYLHMNKYAKLLIVFICYTIIFLLITLITKDSTSAKYILYAILSIITIFIVIPKILDNEK